MGYCYFPPIHIWAQRSRENQGAMLRIITSDVLVVVRGSHAEATQGSPRWHVGALAV